MVFMVVSAADLLYVLGGPLFCLSGLTHFVQFAGNHCDVLVLSVVPRGIFSNAIILYRSLYSSDMC